MSGIKVDVCKKKTKKLKKKTIAKCIKDLFLYFVSFFLYLICSISSMVSCNLALLVSGRSQAMRPEKIASVQKMTSGRSVHMSSKSMIRGEMDAPKRAIKLA